MDVRYGCFHYFAAGRYRNGGCVGVVFIWILVMVVNTR